MDIFNSVSCSTVPDVSFLNSLLLQSPVSDFRTTDEVTVVLIPFAISLQSPVVPFRTTDGVAVVPVPFAISLQYPVVPFRTTDEVTVVLVSFTNKLESLVAHLNSQRNVFYIFYLRF